MLYVCVYPNIRPRIDRPPLLSREQIHQYQDEQWYMFEHMHVYMIYIHVGMLTLARTGLLCSQGTCHRVSAVRLLTAVRWQDLQRQCTPAHRTINTQKMQGTRESVNTYVKYKHVYTYTHTYIDHYAWIGIHVRSA